MKRDISHREMLNDSEGRSDLAASDVVSVLGVVTAIMGELGRSRRRCRACEARQRPDRGGSCRRRSGAGWALGRVAIGATHPDHRGANPAPVQAKLQPGRDPRGSQSAQRRAKSQSDRVLGRLQLDHGLQVLPPGYSFQPWLWAAPEVSPAVCRHRAVLRG
jgi:hypothetical protein